MSEFLTLVLISLIASMGTFLGAFLATISTPNRKHLGFYAGFAGGVMITISFMQLISQTIMVSNYFVAAAGFAGGALTMFLLDTLFSHKHFNIREKGIINPRLARVGILIAIGIALHNLPEGIAEGASLAFLPQTGLLVALAIGLHNIPEGILIAMFTRIGGIKRERCIKIALLAGIAQPIGALLAFGLLKQFIFLVPISLSFAAGVMVFITLDEIIPAAREHGITHLTSFGLILGAITIFILSGIIGW